MEIKYIIVYLRPPEKPVFFSHRSKKKVTLGPLFRLKNEENRGCVTKSTLNSGI